MTAQEEVLKAVSFANEFLKITRGMRVESQRSDALPDDLKQHLANAQLQEIVEKEDIEPEMLVWGLVHLVEILLKISDTSPEEFSGTVDHFLKDLKDNPDRYGDRS